MVCLLNESNIYNIHNIYLYVLIYSNFCFYLNFNNNIFKYMIYNINLLYIYYNIYSILSQYYIINYIIIVSICLYLIRCVFMTKYTIFVIEKELASFILKLIC